MKIPMQLLLDHVHNVKGHLSFPSDTPLNGWYQIQSWHPSWLHQSGILLFAPADEFPDSLEHHGLISVGEPSEALLTHNDILWFELPVDAEDLYLQLQQIILRFSRLDDELNQILHMHGSLQQLTEKAVSFFDNPIMIHDQDFYQLAAAGLTEQDHQ